MVIRIGSTRALVMAGVLASTGSAVVGARSLLTGQADQARSVIPKAFDAPPRADGVYFPRADRRSAGSVAPRPEST